nr:uncharacterized protein LOC109168613 isoform X1 [Ipomoea batatas]
MDMFSNMHTPILVSSHEEPCTEVDVEKATVPQSVTSLHHQLESSSSSTEVEESCDEEKEKYVTPKYFIRFNRPEKQCFKRRMFTLASLQWRTEQREHCNQPQTNQCDTADKQWENNSINLLVHDKCNLPDKIHLGIGYAQSID